MASERQKLEEAALPLMLDAMWAANVMDIQQTLKAVCHEVCSLHVLPNQMRLYCTCGTSVKFLMWLPTETNQYETVNQTGVV